MSGNTNRPYTTNTLIVTRPTTTTTTTRRTRPTRRTTQRTTRRTTTTTTRKTLPTRRTTQRTTRKTTIRRFFTTATRRTTRRTTTVSTTTAKRKLVNGFIVGSPTVSPAPGSTTRSSGSFTWTWLDNSLGEDIQKMTSHALFLFQGPSRLT